MSASLVTIGITCFNAADTIQRAIRSALIQDWPSLEVIIVDDFSSDNSIEAITAAIAHAPHVRLIQRSCNGGPAAARNSILRSARGEFIAFFDDDDESLPSRISNQVKTLTAYEGNSSARLVACYASGVRLYPNGYTLALPAIGSRGAQAPNGVAVANYLLIYRRGRGWFYGSGTPCCSLMARRATFAAAGNFDPELRRLEDADFAIRLAFLGGHFVGTTESLFVQYSTSAPDKSFEQSLEAHERLVCKHRSYLESIGRLEYARRWPRLRYWHFRRRYGRFLVELIGLLARHPWAITWHVLNTGPRRLFHERRMRQQSPINTPRGEAASN